MIYYCCIYISQLNTYVENCIMNHIRVMIKQYVGYFRATRLLKSILIMLMRVDLALKRV